MITLLKKFLGMKLHWQILIMLAVGVVAGLAVGRAGGETAVLYGNVTYVSIFAFVGDLFLRALKMVIVPLIASSIITGVTGVGSGKSLGKMGGKTFGYYVTTSFLAILSATSFSRVPLWPIAP